MDIREFFLLFWKERLIFGVVFLGISAIGIFAWAVQPREYAVELTMNVAREGARETTEYAYDDFYRLQADERFADTVVRWLQSPRIVADIAETAGWRSEAALSFDAGRLSSQVIRVRYRVAQFSDAETIAQAVFTTLNRETTSLNRGETTPAGWFVLVGETPSVADARVGFGKFLVMAGALGLLVAFFSVLIRHTFREDKAGRCARK